MMTNRGLGKLRLAMQQSTPSTQQQMGSTSTTTYTLPREYVEQELADISQSNQRIRQELEAARTTGAFEEVPRSVFPTPSGESAQPSPAGTVFGKGEGYVKRMWGLEEQIKEDLNERPSIAPLPTRESSYETTAAQPPITPGSQVESEPSTPYMQQQTAPGKFGGEALSVGSVGLGYEAGPSTPSVVVVSSIQYEEIAVPETRFQQTQPSSIIEPSQQQQQQPTPTSTQTQQPTAPTTPTTPTAPYESKQYAPRMLGLKSIDDRTKPLKRVIDIFYDKNSMFTWNSNANVFAKWLFKSGILHEGDIIRHLTFSPSFQGVLHGRDLNKNEDALRRAFPEQFPFWLEYFASQIPFEIVFIGPDMQSLKKEIEQYSPSLLLCPVMPEVRSPINQTITREIPKVPVMFAH